MRVRVGPDGVFYTEPDISIEDYQKAVEQQAPLVPGGDPEPAPKPADFYAGPFRPSDEISAEDQAAIISKMSPGRGRV